MLSLKFDKAKRCLAFVLLLFMLIACTFAINTSTSHAAALGTSTENSYQIVDKVNGNNSNTGTSVTKPVKTIYQAYRNLKSTGGLILIVNQAYELAATDDMILSETSFKNGSNTVNLDSGKRVEIRRQNSSGFTGRLFDVPSGAKLTLKSIKLSGLNKKGNQLVIVRNGGTLNITDATFYNNIATAGGAGVINYGTTNISGGTFTNLSVVKAASDTASASGGAIYNSGGTLNITGGTITKCVAKSESTTGSSAGNQGYAYGGAICNVGGGTVSVSNATISECTATSLYNGGYGYGGAIYSNSASTLKIGSGTNIINNTAEWDGGISCNGTFTMTGGTISGNKSGTSGRSGGGLGGAGGGSGWTISGGEIKNNTSPYGAGIMLRGGTVTISGGTISGNVASEAGGGISIGSSTTLNISGGTITGNSTSGCGGGINNSTGTINISGGTISSNTSGGTGGGIHNTGTVNMTAGSIIGNNSTNSVGDGVYQAGTYTLSGSAVINSNNDVHLYDGNTSVLNVGSISSSGIVARITPDTYTLGRKCVVGTNATIAVNAEDNIQLTPNGTMYLEQTDNYLYISDKYPIEYRANGTNVTNNPAPTTKEYSRNISLSSTKPTRVGYSFTGWNTKADGTGTNYAAGASYTANAPLTLYAQWKPYTLTLNFYSNYADTCKSVSVNSSSNTKVYTVTLNYDQEFTLPDYMDSGDAYYMTKSGSTGTGQWHTSTYYNGQKVFGGYTAKAQDIAKALNFNLSTQSTTYSLYAQWKDAPTAAPSEIDYIITNTLDYVNVQVNKTWEDSMNVYGTRPSNITVNLLRNGTKVDSATLDSSVSWGHMFEGLDKYDANGNAYKYTVQEVSVNGYTTTYNYEEGDNVISCNITNTVIPPTTTTTVSGTKTWDDNNNAAGIRPNSITVGLVVDEKTIQTQEVTAANGWKYSFTGLRTGVDYSVIEVNVPSGYEATYNGYNITNKKIETVTIKGNKVWDDGNNAAGLRPEEITVAILADGSIKDYIDVTADDNWAFSVELPKYKAGTTTPIVYTIEEDRIAEYNVSYAKSTSGDTTSYTITNSYAPTPEVLKNEITITGEKVWDDENNKANKRPASVKIQLLRDNVVYQEADITAADNWKFEFSGLEEYKSETAKYVYDVVEANIDSNYTVSYTDSIVNGNAHHVVTNTITDDVQYTVKYIANPPKGNTAKGTTPDSTHVVGVAKNLTANGYSVDGYKFRGVWWKENQSSSVYSDKQSVIDLTTTPNGVVNMYAQWDPIQYYIKYHPNGDGVTGTTPDSTHVYDVSKKMTKNGYVRPGYIFKGWNSKADGTGTPYADLYDVLNWTKEDGKVFNVYAQWEPIKYFIKYDKNSSKATGTTADSTHIYDQAKNMTKNGYSRPGYTWAGWTANADGTGTAYTDEYEVLNWTKENNKTFTVYAKWIPKDDTQYVVKHWKQNLDGDKDIHDDKNYTCVETEIEYLKGTSDTTVTPPVKKYDGFVSAAGQPVTVNIEADGSTVVNYYYHREIYKVTVTPTTGITSVSGGGDYTYGEDVNISAEVKPGYTWKEWKGEYNTDIKDYPFTMPAKNVMETAYATPNPYTVKYLGNGHTAGSTPDSQHIFDKAQNLNRNGYAKEGYKFREWYRDDDSTKPYRDQQEVINLTTELNGVVYMYAQWDPIQYTVKYHANSPNGSTPEGTTPDSKHFFDTPKNLTKNGYKIKGYTFRCWATNPNGTGNTYTNMQEVVNLAKNDGEVVDLYAQWDPIKYEVVYMPNANDAKGTVENSEHIYDVPKNLNENQYTRKGYIWQGWTEKADGSGTFYTDMQEVVNLSDQDGDKVYIYAKWKPIEYDIKYHPNTDGTTGTTPDSHHIYDQSKKLTKNGYEKVGYVFLNWNTKPDGSGTKYPDEKDVLNLTDKDGDVIDLYAQWRPIEYTIVYDKNGATDGSTPDTHHVYDKPGNIADNGYSRPGGTFLGWTTDPEGEGTWYEEGQEVINLTTKDKDVITLYAQWDVRGKLYITKRIKVDDYYDYHGNASFIFKATSVDDPNAQFFGEITFTEEDIKNTNGAIATKETVIDNLPVGEYTIEEVNVDRFEGGITYVSNGTVLDDGTGTFEVEEYLVEIDSIFQNEKTDWSKFSHNDAIINLLTPKN